MYISKLDGHEVQTGVDNYEITAEQNGRIRVYYNAAVCALLRNCGTYA